MTLSPPQSSPIFTQIYAVLLLESKFSCISMEIFLFLFSALYNLPSIQLYELNQANPQPRGRLFLVEAKLFINKEVALSLHSPRELAFKTTGTMGGGVARRLLAQFLYGTVFFVFFFFPLLSCNIKHRFVLFCWYRYHCAASSSSSRALSLRDSDGN